MDRSADPRLRPGRRLVRLARLVMVILQLSLLPASLAAQEGGGGGVALVGVNVLSMQGSEALLDRTVIVRGGRIEAVAPRGAPIPDGTAEIDLTGRWLIPGLVDMHVHIFSRDELPLYLDAGVTSVRNMWGWDLHLELRSEVETGSLLGPRIHTSGRLLDGDPPMLRGSAGLATAQEARAELARRGRAGLHAFKVYDGLPAVALGAVGLAARQAGLPIWGHPPAAVGVDGFLAAGASTWEHMRGLPGEAGSDSGWSGSLDPSLLAALALRVREAGTAVVPTLAVHGAAELSAAEKEALLESPLMARVPEPLRSFCCPADPDAADDAPAAVRETRSANRRRAVAALRGAGVRILVGTDTGNPWVLPGASLHEELKLLVAAGLTVEEVLAAATREAALELEVGGDVGTISEGFRADLLVLESDPRTALHVLASPLGVMVGGRWHRSPPPSG